MAISKRLQKIAEYTKEYNSLADIACDHGYLGIYAAINYDIKDILLTDINPMPLASAIKNTESKNLSSVIKCKLGNGLAPLDKDYEVITISGIGGILMTEILSDGLMRAKGSKRLVLCPNTDSYEVRKFLMENGFKIVDEAMVFEHKYYEIIVCEYKNDNISYTELELKYGPFLLKNRPVEFINYYKEQLSLFEKRITNIFEENAKIKLQNKIDEIKVILNNIL